MLTQEPLHRQPHACTHTVTKPSKSHMLNKFIKHFLLIFSFFFFFFFFLSKTLINYIWIKRKLSLYDKTWFNLISLSSFGTVGRYVRDIKILGYQQLQFGINHYFIFSGEFEYRIAGWSSIICRRNETKRSTLVNTKIASNMKKNFARQSHYAHRPWSGGGGSREKEWLPGGSCVPQCQTVSGTMAEISRPILSHHQVTEIQVAWDQHGTRLG